MRRREPPRRALAWLERSVPDSDALAGDLIEEFECGRSRIWFWWQVLAAVVIAWSDRSVDIRPLHLTDLQPADALERSRRMNMTFQPVNLSASPVSGVGGLGLVALALLVTMVVPGAWWALLASAVAGTMIGIIAIVRRAKSPGASSIRSFSIHVH